MYRNSFAATPAAQVKGAAWGRQEWFGMLQRRGTTKLLSYQSSDSCFRLTGFHLIAQAWNAVVNTPRLQHLILAWIDLRSAEAFASVCTTLPYNNKLRSAGSIKVHSV